MTKFQKIRTACIERISAKLAAEGWKRTGANNYVSPDKAYIIRFRKLVIRKEKRFEKGWIRVRSWGYEFIDENTEFS